MFVKSKVADVLPSIHQAESPSIFSQIISKNHCPIISTCTYVSIIPTEHLFVTLTFVSLVIKVNYRKTCSVVRMRRISYKNLAILAREIEVPAYSAIIGAGRRGHGGNIHGIRIVRFLSKA